MMKDPRMPDSTSVRQNYSYVDSASDMLRSDTTNSTFNRSKYNGASSFNTPPPTKGIKAVSGPAGNYLSNEIFYRVSYLRSTLNPSLPNIHIHIPRAKELLDANSQEPDKSMKMGDIIDQIERTISLAVTVH